MIDDIMILSKRVPLQVFLMRKGKEMRSGAAWLNSVLAVVLVCVFGGAAFGDYCGAWAEEYGYEHITSVEVGAISNLWTGRSSYTDYTHLSTQMYIGAGYSISVINGDAYSGDQCGVWVDWNGDEDFNDVDETIVMSGGPGPFTGVIRPPEGAAVGSTRMRVRIMHTGVLSPCGSTDYGEVEDYTIVTLEFVSPGYGGGSGTAEEPYLIFTSEHMNAIGSSVPDRDAHFELCADIDLGGYTGNSFNRIGSALNPFTGVFDGAGHTISNFTYQSGSAAYIGLFGYIDDANAEVKNLGLIEPDINIVTGSCIGAIAGHLSDGSITNCYVEGGIVRGDWDVGGLVGYGRDNRISDCHSTSNVRGKRYWVGGLVGFNSHGNIFNCYSTGEVTGTSQVGGLVGKGSGDILNSYSTSNVTGTAGVGGLVGGHDDGSMVNCHSTGDVTGGTDVGGLVGSDGDSYISGCYSSSTVTGNWNVGGLVGGNDSGSSICNCYSRGSVTGKESVAGGLVGGNQYSSIFNCYSTAGVDGNGIVGGLVGYNFLGGSILDCYSTGGVTGQQEVGGLAGRNYEVISNCYASGTVTGTGSDSYYVGGLVGRSDLSAETYHCYSVGVVDGNDFVGGLVGYADYSDKYTACFWNSDVNPALSGIGNWTDPDVTGESTVNMQTRSTFTDAGWDFVGEVINGPNDIWDICEGTNYPKLVWSIPEADFVCPDGVNFIDYSFFAGHWYQTDYGDVNGVELSGDGKVNWEDFGLFAEWWMARACGGCGGADFTGEGDVDFLDLDIFSAHWLETDYGDCGGAELTGDGEVGLDDLQRFTASWLAGIW